MGQFLGVKNTLYRNDHVHNLNVWRWFELITVCDDIPEYGKGSVNDSANYVPCLPQTGAEYGSSAACCRLPVMNDTAVYVTRSLRFSRPLSSPPGVGLGGLVPRTVLLSISSC